MKMTTRTGYEKDWIVFSLAIVTYRIGILLLTRTTYHPDEYYQYQEPTAWLSGVYGVTRDSLSWEWQQPYRIRSFSSLLGCTVAYKLVHYLNIHNLQLWAVLPRLLHSLWTIAGDLSLYVINRYLFPENKNIARWSMAFHLFSFFGTFCSARTLSNTVEMNTFCIATALFLHIFTTQKKRIVFRRILLAAASFIITQSIFARPTGLLLYLPMLAPYFFFVKSTIISMLSVPFLADSMWSTSEKIWFVRVTAWCAFVFILVDSAIYGQFTIAPWRFITVNVGQNIAVYFGSSPWYWPLLEGIPVVMGLYAPFLLYQAIYLPMGVRSQIPLFWKIWLLASFSYAVLLRVVTAHQEHRFLLPILPAVHSLLAYVTVSVKNNAHNTVDDANKDKTKRFILFCIFFFQVCGSILLLQYHQMGTEQAFQVVVQESFAPFNNRPSIDHSLPPNRKDENVYLFLAAPCFSFPGYAMLSPTLFGAGYSIVTPIDCSLPPWSNTHDASVFEAVILPQSLISFVKIHENSKDTYDIFVVSFDAYQEVVNPILADKATLVVNVSHAFLRYDYDDPSPKYRVVVYKFITQQKQRNNNTLSVF